MRYDFYYYYNIYSRTRVVADGFHMDGRLGASV